MPAGSLTLYRRHSRTCPHRPKGRRWTRCNCPVWAQGSLGGQWIKDTLNTRDWSAAAATVHTWEAAREIRSDAKVEVCGIQRALAHALKLGKLIARPTPGSAITGARAIKRVTGPMRSTGSSAFAIGHEMIEK